LVQLLKYHKIMAKESNETLKTYFETADVPTAAEFANLIESKIGILDSVEDLPTAAATNLGDKYLIGTTLYTCTLAGSTYSWTGTAWGGGVTAYTDLTSKPTINSVELTGSKTSAQLKVLGTELTGITALGAFASTDIVYVRRGSTWYYGTYADMQTGMIAMIPANLSGTEITTQGSGIVVTIAGSKIGDQYINTTTGDLYQCVDTNTWDWLINLKGVKGDTGEASNLSEWSNEVTTLSDNDIVPCFLSNGTTAKITIANLKTLINGA